jgi:hypothetical protein
MLEKFKWTNPFSLLRQRVGIIPAREKLIVDLFKQLMEIRQEWFLSNPSIALDMFWR